MAGTGRRICRLLLLHQVLLQKQLLLQLLLLLKLLLNLELLVPLQILQMVLRRFPLHQGRSPLQIVATQLIELAEKSFLQVVLLRPQRLPLLLL